MVWVTWRQHRATMISMPAVLGALALFLLFTGLKVHHDYAVLTTCHPKGSAACEALNRTFNGTDWTLGNILSVLMQLLPVLLGMFAGVPLLARELEAGTFRYAWTQGVGRVRLTVAKLVMLAVVVTVLAWAFSQLFTWFFEPFLLQENMNVLEATVFDTRGIAFAAWTLAAFSIGAFLGMLLRRVIPAMAVTLGVYLVLAFGIWPLRKHYPVAVVTDNPGGSPFGFSCGARPLPVVPVLLDQRRQVLDELHPRQPVLADAVHKGRLAAGPRDGAGRGHGLASPPPGRVDRPRRSGTQPSRWRQADDHPHQARRAGPERRRRPGTGPVAGDAVGHLAAAPRRPDRRPGLVHRGGGLHAGHRAEDAS